MKKLIQIVILTGILYFLFNNDTKKNNLDSEKLESEKKAIKPTYWEIYETEVRKKIKEAKDDTKLQFQLALVKWAIKHPKEVKQMVQIKKKYDRNLEKIYLMRRTSFPEFLKENSINGAQFDSLYLNNIIDYSKLIEDK